MLAMTLTTNDGDDDVDVAGCDDDVDDGYVNVVMTLVTETAHAMMTMKTRPFLMTMGHSSDIVDWRYYMDGLCGDGDGDGDDAMYDNNADVDGDKHDGDCDCDDCVDFDNNDVVWAITILLTLAMILLMIMTAMLLMLNTVNMLDMVVLTIIIMATLYSFTA